MAQTTGTRTRWTVDGAGPIQLKRVTDLLSTLHGVARSTVELHGVTGAEEWSIVRRRFALTGPYTRDETTAATEAIDALGEAVGERFGWRVTRENAREIVEALAAAVAQGEKLRPVEDHRTTAEQEAADHAEREQVAKVAEAERERERAAGEARLAPILAKAKGAAALIVAEYHVDTSDLMSDYHANKTTRTVAIGARYGRREDFRQLHAAAARFAETAHLASEATLRAWLAERSPGADLGYIAKDAGEHRENYSMGRGNYLSDHGWDGAGTGWVVKSWPLGNEWRRTHMYGLEDAMPAASSEAPEGDGPSVTASTVRTGYVEVRFAAKPEPEVIAGLKGAGFRWALRSRCWYGPAARCPYPVPEAG